MPQPIASWNPARDVWETDQACLCGHSDVFSETFPTSGMTVAGTAYALPTSEPAILDSESSWLLPTPAAHDSGNTPEEHLRKKPGRTRVTSLEVLARGGMLPSSPPPGRQMEPRVDRISEAQAAI